jgi:hypothetical protein
MTPDMENPVLCRQLTRAVPQRWIILKRQQGIVEQHGVTVVLLLAPPAERRAQNILVIGLCLVRENDRVIRGGYGDSAGGRALLYHGHAA